jgi:predicted TIM-barrel fold metal-dependent hydrolase
MDSPVDVAQLTGVIDCDLHNELPGLKTLYPYLPDHWRAYAEESAFVGPDANDYPAGASTTARPGSRPENGEPAGSDLKMMQEQVLDTWPIAVGILNCSYRVASVHNEDLAASLATALNQWQVDAWLDPEPRLRASIVVPSQNPERAALEIERWGNHPAFVQVVLPVRSLIPSSTRPTGTVSWSASSMAAAKAIPPRPWAGRPPIWRRWPECPRCTSHR